MPRLTLAFALGIAAGAAGLAGILHLRRPTTAELQCPTCGKPFSCHRDYIEAAIVYHEEFDCEDS